MSQGARHVPSPAAAAEWHEIRTADGSWTLFNVALDEGCHSRAGAWQQATARYAGACRLAERARAGGWDACRLLDVGTGLGLNVAAALAALAGTGVPLHVRTFERDPEVIARGVALYERLGGGPWEPWHAAVRAALSAALADHSRPVALGTQGTLALVLGDARATLPGGAAAAFDAAFLDPFSPRRDAALWEEPFLAEVARTLAPRAWLSTYSAAFRVRLGLARAGLRVGRGPRVGAKGEGTLASPDREPPELPSRVVRRLSRRLSPPPTELAPPFLEIR